jgi:type I restriction enzyme S subunit
MKDWKPYTFNEAVECSPKITIKKGEIVENCEMEDIEPNYKFLYPQEGKLYKGSNSKFQNGDTVFARITPCLENGKIAQIKGLKRNYGIGSTEFFVFRGKKNVSDNDFVFYLSKTNLVRDTAVNSMTGASGRQRADIKAVKKIPVSLPPLPTQQRIASILSAYDDLIETNIQRINVLEKAASQLYKEWFVRMRFPDYYKTKFKKGIPDKWEIEKVKNVVNRHKFGRTYRPEELIETGNVIVIDQSTKSLLGYHNNEPDHMASSLKPMIIFGDHTCKMQLMVEDFSLAENVIPVSSKNNIPIYFLYYLIESLVETMEYKRHWNDLVTKSVLIPIDDLQKRYSDIVKPFFEQINILLKQNTELRQIRDRLLPRLVSGKLQVKVDIKPKKSVIA